MTEEDGALNTLFGEKLHARLFALVLPQAFIFVALQAIREAHAVAPAAYNLFFIAQGTFLIAVGLLSLGRPKRTTLKGSKAASVAIAIVTLLLGCGPTVVAIGTALVNPLLVLAGAAVAGVSQAVSYLQCFRLYAALPMRPRVAFIVLCFALAPTLRLPLVFAPMIARCALAALFPLGCCLLCRVSAEECANRLGKVVVENPLRGETGQFAPYIAVIALFGFALGCFYAPFDSGVMGTAACASAFLKTVVLFIVLWLLVALFDRIAIDHLCQIVLLVTVAALAVAAQFGAHDPWGIAAATADLAWYVMVTLLYVLLAAISTHSRMSPSALFALGWTPYLFAKVAGTAAAGMLQTTDGVGFLVLLPLCVIGGAALVFLNIRRDATNLLFAPDDPERGAREARTVGAIDEASASGGTASAQTAKAQKPLVAAEMQLADADKSAETTVDAEALDAIPLIARESGPSRSRRDEEALEHIGSRFALTEREREVMTYIYQGYSKRAIAEKLFLSQNTVRTHARTLYAKLGIHSRDALLDLVNEESVGR